MSRDLPDPWTAGSAPAAPPAVPAPEGTPEAEMCAGGGRVLRHAKAPAVTWCRVCGIPLCGECRIDHHHEGWQ